MTYTSRPTTEKHGKVTKTTTCSLTNRRHWIFYWYPYLLINYLTVSKYCSATVESCPSSFEHEKQIIQLSHEVQAIILERKVTWPRAESSAFYHINVYFCLHMAYLSYQLPQGLYT